MRATFAYWTGKTREAAEAALEEFYATGEVSECEVAGIKMEGGKWRVLLWA